MLIANLFYTAFFPRRFPFILEPPALVMYTDVNVICNVGCFLAGIQRREISRLHLCRSLYTMKARTEKSHWNHHDIHKLMLKLINWKWIFCYWLRGMIKLNPHSQYNLAKYFVGDIYSE